MANQNYPEMTITELNNKYKSGELSLGRGNRDLRFNALSPLFKNLYENKVVYHEGFTSIITLEDIELSPHFYAEAKIHLLIDSGVFKNRPVPETWSVGANWAFLNLNGDRLSPYAGWLMWTDPVLVKKVEKLVLENNMDEALNMTIRNH